jgi:putative radical SAM enzyme (TIGR03279 family)
LTKLHNGIVSSVDPDSIAEEAGILPGDIVVSINGHDLTDIIDYRFYSAEEDVDLLLRRGDEEAIISIEKDFDDPIGITFENELFDGVRTCKNRCVFCFVNQLPTGMRRSLYLKDDDYRLSFLHGNFVTLTNVDDTDIERIIEQRLSPLYISVHATEPDVRNRMLLGKKSPDIMGQLAKLADGGISLHTQIVLCPGLNDGKHLERTVRDLASFHPAVASIGIVPVGLTMHRKAMNEIKVVDADDAREIIRKVRWWQREFAIRGGSRLVWAADELYLLSGTQVPSDASYEWYPQLENGIGLVRRFMDNTRRTLMKIPKRLPHPVTATIVTSTLAATLLNSFADKLNQTENLSVTVAPIVNHFFGEEVTVAGLITGKDILEQLKGQDIGDMVLVPSVMIRDEAFLDDITISELAAGLGKPVIAVEPLPSGVLKALINC